MGCGASARPPPKESEESVAVNVGESTWATKIPAGDNAQGIAQGSLFTPSAKAHQGNSAASKNNSNNIVVLDAEDNDSDIEIIYETPTNRQAAKNAANGQEPPDDLDPEPYKSPEPAKPLSKQQQDEAAKLADTRKRFDNQRYQREQRTDAPLASGPSDATSLVDTQGYPDRRDQNRLPSKPATEMMLGLNVTEVQGNKERSMATQCMDLPGGIFDEPEDFQPVSSKKMRQQNQHDDVKSTGFDDDDEKLMKEILENCEDM